MKLKSKTKRWIATILTLGLAVFFGLMSNPYLLALSLGIGTLYTTILEFEEDWLLAIVDLAITGLLTLGGSQVGVFGMVVGLGIAFAASMFLPDFMVRYMPFLSWVWWKQGGPFGHKNRRRREA